MRNLTDKSRLPARRTRPANVGREVRVVRRTVGLFCALALAGCAESGKLVEQSVTAKDVPIHFAYGSLRDADAKYSGAESGVAGAG
jgi:hypothetical protein